MFVAVYSAKEDTHRNDYKQSLITTIVFYVCVSRYLAFAKPTLSFPTSNSV